MEKLSLGTSTEMNQLSQHDQMSLKQLKLEANYDRMMKRDHKKNLIHQEKMGHLQRNFITSKPPREKYVSLDNSEHNLRYLTEQSQYMQKELGLGFGQRKLSTEEFIEIGRMYSTADNRNESQHDLTKTSIGFNNL